MRVVAACLGSEWKDEQTQRGLARVRTPTCLPPGGQRGVCSREPWLSPPPAKRQLGASFSATGITFST